jgi:hypothetical protein
MATQFNQTRGNLDDFWAVRDSLYLASVINQYDTKIDYDPRQEVRIEALVRKALFLPELRGPRRDIADHIRRSRRQSAVPLFISLLWFTMSLAFSIVQAFVLVGDNATAHNLAMGLLMGWLPVFITASIVDRNPHDAIGTKDQLNGLFRLARREKSQQVLHAIDAWRTLSSKRTTSDFRKYWLQKIIQLSESAQTDDTRDMLKEELEKATSWPQLRNWQPLQRNGSYNLIIQWARREDNLEVLGEFCGQGRHPWHFGISYPVLIRFTKSLPTRRNWVGRYREICTEFSNNRDEGTLKTSKSSLILPLSMGCLVVKMACFGAFWISYNTPTVGLGCRVSE